MNKKITAFILAVATIFSCRAPVYARVDLGYGPEVFIEATEKQEVIYINLNYDGSVSDITAVNIFDMDKPGNITDYGNYSSVRNMTSDKCITYREGIIKTIAPKGKLYYEGTCVSNEIPWNFKIRYFLDGKELSADEIIGKSGEVKVTIESSKNENMKDSFFKKFALQVSFTLDAQNCKNIKSDNATMANVGKDKQLTYIVLPDTDTKLEFTTETTFFEMSSISLNGVLMSIDVDTDSLNSEDIDKDMDELIDAVIDLDEAADEFVDAGTDLTDGVEELKDGVKELKDGAKDAYKGSKELSDGLLTLKGNNSSIMDGAYKIFCAMCSSAETSINGNEQLQAAFSQLGIGAVALTPENYSSVLTQTAETFQSQADSIPSGVSQEYDQKKTLLSTVAATLLGAKSQLDDFNTFYTGLKQYTDGVGTAATGSRKLTSGLKEMRDGCDELYDGVDELYEGVIDLNDGFNELKDGTSEFRDETKDLKGELREKIEDAIDEILGDDIELVSFTSPLNKKIESVQFVIKTPEMTYEEPEEIETAEEEKTTFIQKFFKLFGIEI